jgi:hypothetical protein
MAIDEKDPSLVAFKLARELALSLGALNDPESIVRRAGEALHALSRAIGLGLEDAIQVRLVDVIPLATKKTDPGFAALFQQGMARLWLEVMADNVPMGEMLSHGLLRLSQGDQPELLTRAPAPEGERRSSKPMSQDLEHAKRMLVLRACFDAGKTGKSVLVLLSDYTAGKTGRGSDTKNLKAHWLQAVPASDRAIAVEAGSAQREGKALTLEQEGMVAQVTRRTPEDFLAYYMRVGGAPR